MPPQGSEIRDFITQELKAHLKAFPAWKRPNGEFTRPPTDPASAFVPLGAVDLAQILCYEEDRTVGQDNTVVLA